MNHCKTISFWDIYYQQPIDRIPWQHTQADWFKDLVDRNILTGTTAIDLGCGTGQKAIYLAQRTKFSTVLGVDIAPQAIKIAQDNARQVGADPQCRFIVGNIANWDFLAPKITFDLIIDWAAIHCLPPECYPDYAQSINIHSRPGTQFLLRFFSNDSGAEKFTETVAGADSEVYYLSPKKDNRIIS
ncbi:methyltransferase domain-containing protein [Patescibacteria group bacterium]|nr:methyltransferase domain-containing protein [Patescibacteria group bacterium]